MMIAMFENTPTKPKVVGSSRAGRASSPPRASTQGGDATAAGKRIATPVDWLTFEQACFLSGWNEDEIIDEGDVDLNLERLIEKRSLKEFKLS
jgi:hypothetical protein